MKILVTLPLNERQKERLEMNFRHLKFCYCLKKDVTEEVIRGRGGHPGKCGSCAFEVCGGAEMAAA